MSLIPLQLERSFFTKLHIDVNQEYRTEQNKTENAEVEIAVGLNVAQHNTDPHRYQIRLTIDGIEGKEAPTPYNISLQIVGYFVVDNEFEHNHIAKLVEINGASILYSAAREQVLNVTGRGPWGAFQLPTINFNNTKEK